jgi:hypothetical protein
MRPGSSSEPGRGRDFASPASGAQRLAGPRGASTAQVSLRPAPNDRGHTEKPSAGGHRTRLPARALLPGDDAPPGTHSGRHLRGLRSAQAAADQPRRPAARSGVFLLTSRPRRHLREPSQRRQHRRANRRPLGSGRDQAGSRVPRALAERATLVRTQSPQTTRGSHPLPTRYVEGRERCPQARQAHSRPGSIQEAASLDARPAVGERSQAERLSAGRDPLLRFLYRGPFHISELDAGAVSSTTRRGLRIRPALRSGPPPSRPARSGSSASATRGTTSTSTCRPLA